jgi:hypothetical protein
MAEKSWFDDSIIQRGCSNGFIPVLTSKERRDEWKRVHGEIDKARRGQRKKGKENDTNGSGAEKE